MTGSVDVRHSLAEREALLALRYKDAPQQMARWDAFVTQAGALSPAMQRQYRLNVGRYYAYQFACSLALWSPIWVLYLQDERGLSLTQITALDAPFWLIAIAAEIPTGTVADRWGRKTSLLWGAVVYAVALFLFGTGSSYPILLLSYLTWPLAMALQSGADSAFLYDSLHMVGREEEFRKATGRAQAINSAGFLLGGLAGAPLAAATSLGFPIVASAAIILLAVLVAITFREPRHEEHGPSLPYMATMRTAIRFAVQHPALRWMIVVRAVLLGTGLIGIIFTQPFLASFDVPVAHFGLLTTPLRIVAIAAALIVYRVVARTGERALLYALAAGAAGALLLMGVIPSLIAFTGFSVLAVCNAAAGVLSADYINRHSPQQLRATIMSVAQMVFSALLFIAEPSLGFIADRTSLQVMFLVAGVAMGVLAALALTAWTASDRNAASVEPEPEMAGAVHDG